MAVRAETTPSLDGSSSKKSGSRKPLIAAGAALALAAGGAAAALWPKQEGEPGGALATGTTQGTTGPSGKPSANGGGIGGGGMTKYKPSKPLTSPNAICEWLREDRQLVVLIGSVVGQTIDPASCRPRINERGDAAALLLKPNKEFVLVVDTDSDARKAELEPEKNAKLHPLSPLPGVEEGYCDDDSVTNSVTTYQQGGFKVAMSYVSRDYKNPQGFVECGDGVLNPPTGALVSHIASVVAASSALK